MNIKIICWRMKDKFIIDEGIELLDKTNDLNRRIYYQLKMNKIEVIFYENNKFNEINLQGLSARDNNLIFLMEEIDDNKLEYINKNLKDKCITIFSGKKNIITDENSFNKLIYLPQLLSENEKINLYSLILMVVNNLNNEDKLFNNINKSNIILGCEESSRICGNIPLFILKRFYSFQNLKSFHLNLFLSEKINLQDIAYMEDALSSYIKDDGVLKITQLENEKNNKNYFCLIAK